MPGPRRRQSTFVGLRSTNVERPKPSGRGALLGGGPAGMGRHNKNGAADSSPALVISLVL
jgi:hypothetical protein